MHQRHLLCLLSLISTVNLDLFAADKPAAKTDKTTEDVVVLEKFVTEAEEGDPNRIAPNQPTQSVVGLARSLYDTPRSATNISSEFLTTLAIRSSEDIARIAPSTYSNYRFGLQGNVSVRNQTSDFYFRGMRRIDPQGNYRTIYAANDSIEIVRGPPSSIYGLGRIGGYVNFNPKTARLEKTGKYLEKATGDIAYTYGSYNKNIVTVDVGGPVKVAGRNGGYQVFGYYEDSDSYYVLSPHDRHKIVQATFTLDLNPSWRLETGGVSQFSFGGLPGGINRTTQGLVNANKYWNGTFSYNMDRNGDGRISDAEIFQSYRWDGLEQARGVTASTALNNNIRPSPNYIGAVNAPLNRRVPWQGGPVNGGTITVDQFLAGYTDPATNLHREGYQLMIFPQLANGQPNTAAAKQAFYMPAAFDPKLGTWNQVDFDNRYSFGEDFYRATVYTFFFDLVNDSNPDFTYKNQVLLDTQDQEKTGRNPFSQFQTIFKVEDKITVTKHFQPKWEWLDQTLLGSLNGVYYDGGRFTDNTVDYDYRRSLLTGFTPNDTFTAFTKTPGFEGSALSQYQKSNYTQWGIGFLSETVFFRKFTLLVGGRFDSMTSEAFIPAGIFLRNGNGGITAASTDPSFKGYNDYAKTEDSGKSYSASLSYEPIKGFKPYATWAVVSAPIDDASTGGIPVANVRRGPFGEAELKEYGFKASYFNGKLFFAADHFEQTRNNFDPNDGAGAIGATLTKGYEAELRWAVTKQFSLTAAFSDMKTINLISTGNVTASARFLGFPDVVDAAGNVVIPAEAFGWGGILQTAIPADDHRYDEINGVPNTIYNLTALYAFKNGFSVRLTGYHQSSFSPDRLQTVHVPGATAFDAGFAYTFKPWEIRVNIVNLFDKRYYNGGSFNSVAARLPRMADVTVRYSF